MKYEWNWTDFFQQDIQPPFLLKAENTEQCHQLLNLPFVQGLEVIVTSVPLFDHQQWCKFQTQLTPHRHQHKHIDYWLTVGQLVHDYLDEVRHLLNADVEQAIKKMQALLKQQDNMEQFALMACLHYYSQSSFQARMMLQYLLQNGDLKMQQLENVLDFYHSLTERQKDVAVLTAQGLTNQEIAESLYIEPKVVAEHLTAIFSKFQQMIQYCPDKHGTRYRLIHWLTRLFIQHPELLLERKF
jgi:hypothetical protein